MAYSEDHIALAAEYALGTLDANERSQVETMMSIDSDFTAIVEAWEYRLGVLNQMVGSVEPRPIVWENIRNAIARAERQAPIMLTDSPSQPQPQPQPPPPPEEAIEPTAPPIASITPIVDTAAIIRLSRRARRWRSFSGAMTAIAAVLVAMISISVYRPELLPEGLRPKPRTRLVEVRMPAPPPVPSAQYVAILQGQGGSPAFILTVDGATKNFTVRKVGGNAEPGRSFELWLISDRLPRPRSLGVIGGDEFTARAVLASYDTDVINNATYAVTVEQAGGSPDGAPHSTPVYAGKLIETVPASPPVSSRPR
jgi:anti-sigma-K factor RskA